MVVAKAKKAIKTVKAVVKAKPVSCKGKKK